MIRKGRVRWLAKEMWSAKLTSSASCSDFLPTQIHAKPDLYWPEVASSQNLQRNLFAFSSLCFSRPPTCEAAVCQGQRRTGELPPVNARACIGVLSASIG